MKLLIALMALFMTTSVMATGRGYTPPPPPENVNNGGGGSNIAGTLFWTGVVVCGGRTVYVGWTTGNWRMCFTDEAKPVFTGRQQSPRDYSFSAEIDNAKAR